MDAATPDTSQEQLAIKISDELISVCDRDDMRAVHTLGIGATGTFQPSPVARKFCIATHFQGDGIPVTVRFSNGAGNSQRHDGWSDVRGLAVRFHLDGDPNGTDATDLIAMTLPLFFTRTGEEFYDFIVEGRPKPCFRQSPWQKIREYLAMKMPMPDPYPGQTKRPDEGAMAYADRHDFAKLAVLLASDIGAPENYAMARYSAVHTFVVTDPDNVKRHVRFSWEPVDGVLKKRPRNWPHDDGTEPPELDYLDRKLKERIALAPARFSLVMTIGEIGDDFDDPTRPWPPHRVRVIMGTLILDAVPEAQELEERIEKMSFNPLRLTEGIAPSADPILAVRGKCYQYSSERRGGTACPFSWG